MAEEWRCWANWSCN